MPFGPFQILGDDVGGHAVRRLAVDRRDDVAGTDAGAERRRAFIRRDDVDLVVLLLDHHADAVVVAALIFAHLGVGLGIVEIRVRIEDAQHAGNGAVVDGRVGLVALDGLGVVLLDHRVDVGERLQAVANLAFILRRLGSHPALQKGAGDGAHGEKDDKAEKCPAGGGSHSGRNLRSATAQAPQRDLAGQTWAKV